MSKLNDIIYSDPNVKKVWYPPFDDTVTLELRGDRVTLNSMTDEISKGGFSTSLL